jgi:outer membrane protein TolC
MSRIPRLTYAGLAFAAARRLPRMAPGAACGFALAALLGACGTAGPVSGPAAQEAAPVASSRTDSLVPAALKNAEAAMLAYNSTRKNENAARQAALAASSALLVARHRFSTGTGDYVEVVMAQQHLASAEDQLKIASADAQAARQGLYRSFGLSSLGAVKVPVSAPAPLEPQGEAAPL